MPKYLVEGRYTSDGLKGLAREGASRRRGDIEKMIESAGGKLEAIYFAFGDADFYIILDAPDNVSAAALSAADKHLCQNTQYDLKYPGQGLPCFRFGWFCFARQRHVLQPLLGLLHTGHTAEQ